MAVNRKSARKRKSGYGGYGGNYGGYSSDRREREYAQYRKKNKFINRMIFCLCAALLVMVVNMVDSPVTNTIKEKVGQVFSSDYLSLGTVKDKIVGFVDKGVAKITGDDVAAINQDGGNLTLLQPVDGEIISKFEDQTHPVFKTAVKPRGIEYKARDKAEVKASATGKVSNVIASSYGGSRIVVDIGNNTTCVYDGVKTNFVKVGDKVNKGSVIGTMDGTDGNRVLGFEVWMDNQAVDPEEYLKSGK